jgi:RNase P/RNase MRP subunit p30
MQYKVLMVIHKYLDQNRRRMFISNAMILVKATKGRNIILSSDTSTWLYHRSPYDLVALYFI